MRLFKTFFVPTLLFFAAAGYLLIGINQPANILDEGVIAYGAKKVLDGAIPYRDFWTFYPPAQFYIVAWLFNIFGTNLFVLRLYDVLIQSTFALGIYLLTAYFTSRIAAVVAWFSTLLLIVLAASQNSGSLLVSMLLILGAIFFIFRFLENGKKKLLLAAGLFCGLSTLFRTDLGFYGATGISLGILISTLKDSTKKKLLTIGFFITGFTVPILITMGYLLKYVQFRELAYDLLVFPITIFPKVRSLPILGNENQFLFYLAIVIFVLSILALSKVGQNRSKFRVLVVLGIIMLLKGASRLDPSHMIPALTFTIICATTLFYCYTRSIKSKFSVPYLVLCLLIAPFIVISPLISVYISLYFIRSFSPLLCHSNQPRSGCAQIEKNQQQAIDFIQEKTTKDDFIFSGNSHHDQIFANDVMFYFLSERESAVKHYEFNPGLTNTQYVQNEIVKSLQQNNVKYLVLYSGFDNHYEKNQSSISTEVFTLDNHIKSQYQEAAAFGPYKILHNVQLN